MQRCFKAADFDEVSKLVFSTFLMYLNLVMGSVDTSRWLVRKGYFLPGKAKLKPNRFAFILSLNITTATFSVKVESWLKKNWIWMRLISGSGRTAKYFYATLLKIYGGLRYFFANRLQQIEDNTTSGQ